MEAFETSFFERSTELLTTLMASQGIPYNSISEEGPLREIIKHFNPLFEFPTEETLLENASKISFLSGQYAHAPGLHGIDISVTYDIVGQEEKFMAFSVHTVQERYVRKNMVYLRSLEIIQPDSTLISDIIRQTIRKDLGPNANIVNMVSANEELNLLVNTPRIAKRNFICFYHRITLFVEEVMKIEDFANTRELFRNLVTTIKEDAVLLTQFNLYNANSVKNSRLPRLPQNGWQDTARFLAECIPLYESLVVFAERSNLLFGVNHETFLQFVYFNTIIQTCHKFVRSISGPLSSISQVIPSILMMRKFILNHTKGCQFKERIRDSFANVFKKITSGVLREVYDMSSLLDPRFGYREDLYSEKVWLDIEKKVVAAYSRENSTRVNKTTQEIKTFINQIRMYRRACKDARPFEEDDPASWLMARNPGIEKIAYMFKKFFVCPAVSIDAGFFFGQNGKFGYLCNSLQDSTQLSVALEIASYSQQFRGRGLRGPIPEDSKIPMIIEPSETSLQKRMWTEETIQEPTHSLKRVKTENEVEEQSNLMKPLSSSVGMKEIKEEEPDEYETSQLPSTSGMDSDSLWNDPNVGSVSELILSTQSPAKILEVFSKPCKIVPNKRKHYCVICGKQQYTIYIRHVKLESEKLLVCLGALYNKLIQPFEANNIYKKNQLVMCRSHFSEAASVILALLNLPSFHDISILADIAFSNLMVMAMEITKNKASIVQFRNQLYHFTKKNHNLSDSRPLRATDIKLVQDEEEPSSPGSDGVGRSGDYEYDVEEQKYH